MYGMVDEIQDLRADVQARVEQCAELRTECERLRAELESEHRAVIFEQARRENAETKLAEALKDTERLDWLEAHGFPLAENPDDSVYKVGSIAPHWSGKLAQLVMRESDGLHWKAITFRAAIDAAHELQTKENQCETVSSS